MDDLAESPDVVFSAPLNTMKLAPVTVVVGRWQKGGTLFKSTGSHLGVRKKLFKM